MTERDVTIKFRGNSSDLQKGAATASEALSSTEKQANLLQKSLESIAQGIGQGIGQSVTSFLGGLKGEFEDAINATAEYERVLFTLDNQIASSAGSIGLTRQELVDFADQLGDATLTSEEATLRAARSLSSFRKVSGDTFTRALTLSQDLAEVMGGSLEGNVVQLGKALEDPVRGITALARAGTTFTEEQKAMIESLVESGDLLAAQNIVLDELERQYGGAGVAAAQGLAGALDTMGENANDLRRAFGEGLQDPLTDIVNQAQQAQPALQELAQAAGSITGDGLLILSKTITVIGENSTILLPTALALVAAFNQQAIAAGAAAVQTQFLAVQQALASGSALSLARNIGASVGKLGLFAAAGASVGFVVDTFREMNEEAEETAIRFSEARDEYERYLESLAQDPDTDSEGRSQAIQDIVESNRQQLRDDLSWWQGAANAIQEQFLTNSDNTLGGSIIDAKIAEQSEAFIQAQGEMDNLIQEFQKLDAQGLETVSSEQLGAFRAAVEASASALAEEQPLTIGAAIAKEQYTEALEGVLAQLNAVNAAEQENQEQTGLSEEAIAQRIEAFEHANAQADAAASRSQDERVARIRQSQLEQLRAEGLTAADRVRIVEQSERAIEEIQTNALNEQMGRLQDQLAEINTLEMQGVLTAEEAADRRSEIQGELAQTNLQRIEAELEAQERAIEEAKQAELDAIEEVRLAANNQADQKILKIEAMIQAQDRLNQSMGMQLELMGAQSNLLGAINDRTDSSYGIAIELTTDEDDRAALEEEAAQARIEGLERSQAIEQQIFDLGILRRDIELEIEAIRLRSARARNQADQADAQAAIDQARAEGASQEELNALQNRYNATLQEGQAIDAEEEGIRQSRMLLQQTASLERESMLNRQRQEMDRERVNRAQAIVDPEERDRALDFERRRALRNARSGGDRSEEVFQQANRGLQQFNQSLTMPSLTAQPMNNIVPMQGGDFRQAITELGDRLTNNPTAVNQTNTVNIYPATAQALEQDVEGVVLDQFDKVAAALER